MMHESALVPWLPLSDHQSGGLQKRLTLRVIRSVVATILAAVVISLLNFPALEWNQKCSQQLDAARRGEASPS